RRAGGRGAAHLAGAAAGHPRAAAAGPGPARGDRAHQAVLKRRSASPARGFPPASRHPPVPLACSYAFLTMIVISAESGGMPMIVISAESGGMPRSGLLRVIAGLLALTGITGVAACSPDVPDTTGKIKVVAGFYPLRFAAERVGGAAVAVTSLAEAGAEPHDLELSPRQVAQVADADLVVHLKGFQPSLDETVAQEATSAAF